MLSKPSNRPAFDKMLKQASKAIRNSPESQIARLEADLAKARGDLALRDLDLAAMCDAVLGEDADDRSNTALVRAVCGLKRSLDEEVRLNGKGSEREAALRGKISRLERELAAANARVAELLRKSGGPLA